MKPGNYNNFSKTDQGVIHNSKKFQIEQTRYISLLAIQIVLNAAWFAEREQLTD